MTAQGALNRIGIAVLLLAAILAVKGMTDRSTPLTALGLALLGGSWLSRRSRKSSPRVPTTSTAPDTRRDEDPADGR